MYGRKNSVLIRSDLSTITLKVVVKSTRVKTLFFYVNRTLSLPRSVLRHRSNTLWWNTEEKSTNASNTICASQEREASKSCSRASPHYGLSWK